MGTSADYIQRTLSLANEMSPSVNEKWLPRHLENCDLTYDACSGQLGHIYRKLFGRRISCHWCCVLHDFLYSIGAPRSYRGRADKILFDCAASAGGWRVIRAWIMYAAVRIGGGRYWSEA